MMNLWQKAASAGTDLSVFNLVFYSEIFRVAPEIVISDILARVYDLTVAATIVCLLAIFKNRKRIRRFDALMADEGNMTEKARRSVD